MARNVVQSMTDLERQAFKVRLVKLTAFVVATYGSESWTMKKNDNDAFELWCYRRILRVPWTEKRTNM